MGQTLLIENCADRIHCVADLKLRVVPAFRPAAGAPEPPNDALLPGINEVDAEEWAKAEKIPLVQHYLEEGILKVRRQAPELTQLKPKEAHDLVRRTVDRTLLEKWYGTEKRRDVLEAIERQIQATKLPDGGK
jgi:hypothetical protein